MGWDSELTNLPDGLLLETMAYLDATDLFHVCEIGACRKAAENEVFIKRFLERERLPGDCLGDLLRHMERWEKYKEDLQSGLRQIVFAQGKTNKCSGQSRSMPLAEKDNADKEETVRAFLRDAIFNFTNRAAGAQPWYEQLPLGPGTGFEFVLDLTANMRQVGGSGGKWTEFAEGDGTRVLPTWLSTRDYRAEYGFFQFKQQEAVNAKSPFLIVHDEEGSEYYVPGCCRPDPVLLTGVLHRAASGLNMYTRILQRTVESGCAEQAQRALTPEMLPSASWFRRLFLGRKQKLPEQAGVEMRERANILIRQQHHVSQAVIWTNANQVLLRQQRREWNDISLSLWKLCRCVYGPDLTPSLSDMFEPSLSDEPET